MLNCPAGLPVSCSQGVSSYSLQLLFSDSMKAMTLCLPFHYWQLSILCGNLWPWSFLGGCFRIEDMKESTWRTTQRRSRLSNQSLGFNWDPTCILLWRYISIGNQQELFGTVCMSAGRDLIGITEMTGNGAYDWSFGMEGCRLFRKSRKGRWERRGGVTLCQWPTVIHGALPWRSCMMSQMRVYRSGL